jgi:hypothetical protein
MRITFFDIIKPPVPARNPQNLVDPYKNCADFLGLRKILARHSKSAGEKHRASFRTLAIYFVPDHESLARRSAHNMRLSNRGRIVFVSSAS